MIDRDHAIDVLKRWEHCACTQYVPPGMLPEDADLSLLPS